MKAHAFVDGNKRTAGALCLMWLYRCGIDLAPAHEDDFFDLVVETARGDVETQAAVRARLARLC